MTKDAKEEKQILLEKAFRLHLAGYDFEIIARELGFEDMEEMKAGIYQIMMNNIEPPEFLKSLSIRRYEELLKQVWPFAVDRGDNPYKAEAMRLALTILREEGRLMGVYKHSRSRDLSNRITVVWDVPVRLDKDDYLDKNKD